MKNLTSRRWMVLLIIADLVLCGAFVLTGILNKKEAEDRQITKPNIQKICELATLECYYHNVSDWGQDAYGIFGSLGYGKKKIWIEYDGIVYIGIRGEQVKVSEPDKDNVITVTIPEATVLGKDLDENTIQEITSDVTVMGLFTDRVNSDDRLKALAGAQEEMVKTANNNGALLNEARELAKVIIERNIVAAGEAGGKHYTVRFVDATETETPTTAPAE